MCLHKNKKRIIEKVEERSPEEIMILHDINNTILIYGTSSMSNLVQKEKIASQSYVFMHGKWGSFIT